MLYHYTVCCECGQDFRDEIDDEPMLCRSLPELHAALATRIEIPEKSVCPSCVYKSLQSVSNSAV